MDTYAWYILCIRVGRCYRKRVFNNEQANAYLAPQFYSSLALVLSCAPGAKPAVCDVAAADMLRAVHVGVCMAVVMGDRD